MFENKAMTRRNFLEASGSLALGVALAPLGSSLVKAEEGGSSFSQDNKRLGLSRFNYKIVGLHHLTGPYVVVENSEMVIRGWIFIARIYNCRDRDSLHL